MSRLRAFMGGLAEGFAKGSVFASAAIGVGAVLYALASAAIGVGAVLYALASIAFGPDGCPVFNAEPHEPAQPGVSIISIDDCPPCEVLEATLKPILAEYRCPFSVAWIKHVDGGQIGWEYPTVTGVVRFEEVSRFTGMRPEPDLRAFLDDLVEKAQPR